jgi:hypothetical protein
MRLQRTGTMRSTVALVLAALSVLALAGCHESELEPRTPDAIWVEPNEGSLEAAYAMAPVPAVTNPAPQPESQRRRSISLGYIGDAPLTQAPPSPPHWPYVAEPFRYRDPYPRVYGRGYRYGRHHASAIIVR